MTITDVLDIRNNYGDIVIKITLTYYSSNLGFTVSIDKNDYKIMDFQTLSNFSKVASFVENFKEKVRRLNS